MQSMEYGLLSIAGAQGCVGVCHVARDAHAGPRPHSLSPTISELGLRLGSPCARLARFNCSQDPWVQQSSWRGRLVDAASAAAGRVGSRIRERILLEADLPGQVQAAMTSLEPELRHRTDGLGDLIATDLTEDPTESWRAPLERLAVTMANRSAA